MNAADAAARVPHPGSESPSELAAVLTALPDPVFLLRAVRDVHGTIEDLRYTYLNEAAAQLYGLPAEAVLGRGFCESFPMVRELGIFDIYVSVIETGSPASFEAPPFLENGAAGSFWRTAVRFDDGVLVSVCDITAQRQAERSLAATSERYRVLAEHAADIVVQGTPDGVITWVSPSVTAVLGWRPAELVGRDGLDFVHPDQLAAAREALSGTAATGKQASDPTRLRCADGSHRWVSGTWRPITDGSGKVIARVSGIRDVQTEVEAEQALAESEHHYRLLAENASDIVAMTTPERVITWVSPSVTAFMGWRPDELVGRNTSAFAHPDEFPALRDHAERIDPHEPVSGRMRLRRADGSYRWVSRTWRPLTDDSGAVVARVVGIRDVQTEVDAEQALAESEHHYRLLAENASDVVLLAGPDGLVSWMSPTVTGTLGWEPADLVGTDLVDLTHPADRAAMEAARDAVYSGREVTAPAVGFVGRMRTKSGDYRWISSVVTPVTAESGAWRGVVAGWRDVDDLVHAQQAAQTDRDHLRATIDSLLDPHMLLEAVRDATGQIVDFVCTDANPAACAYHGLDRQDLVGVRLLVLVPGYAGADLLESYRRVVETGEPLMADDVLVAPGLASGPERHYDIRAARVGDGLSATWRDTTDRYAVCQALSKSEEQYRLLTENASDVVMRLSLSRTFEWVSDPVTEILGWRPPDLVGHPIGEFIHPDDLARFRQIVADAPGSASSIEFRFRCADGSYQWVACRTRAKVDQDGAPVAVVGAMVDITDRKAAEAELTFSASHDPLTGLANRTMLVDEADRALTAGQRSGRTTALLMVDLDHFKNINDTLGHAVGDALLRTVAGRIAGSVRSVDLVARHGGDEFVVLLRDLDDPGDALRLAERLVVESRQPVTVGGTELYATASAGIASAIPGLDPVRGAADLIREADTAMYAAKLAGRDRVAQFTDDLRRTVDDRMHLESDLRHALVRDELAVWYQPEIDLHDGTVRAAEALLRWRHPTGQVREAAQFIDVAEDSGLLLDIGAWVLHRACADAARWATHDPPRHLVLRVNLSPLELSGPDLLTTLDAALGASRLDPGLLCIEITETTVLSDSSTVRANLEGISARGIDLAIDDFGTGYGSLTYLRRYPIDVLKIDRSFVTHITTDANDHRLVAGVVALADRLDISVTAEGIETADQAQVLRSLGCAGAQGFLYAPALSSEDLAEFLGRSQPALTPVSRS